MGDIINLNCVTTLDIDPDRVIDAAKKEGLESVVILGYTKDGDEYFCSSIADGSDVNWLLDRCKLELLTADKD